MPYKIFKVHQEEDGREIDYIAKSNTYIKVMDHGEKSILKEIVIAPGQHTWVWVSLYRNKPIDISPAEHDITSFDRAFNNAICDLYCTVFGFEDFAEALIEWKHIRYEGKLPIMYKAEEENS